MDLRYVEADESVVRQIAELSRKEYGDVELSSLSYLRWKHLENPHGTSKFYLLYEGEQLIGKLGLLPRKFWRNGESINAAYLVDLLIDREHRGLKTFLLLMSSLTQNPDFDFLFLTPNSNSMLLYER